MSRDELVGWLRGDDLSETDIAEEVDYEQALRILQADTPEAIFTPDAVVKVDELLGQTFAILRVSWRKGEQAPGDPNRYAFVACADENGEPFYTSMGGTKVVLKLRKAELEGWLPRLVTLQAITTNNGRTMHELVDAPAPL